MNITTFREMPIREQHQALAAILTEVGSERVIDSFVDKKGNQTVFGYVIPEYDEEQLSEFKRELDTMGFSTEIQEIDNELNLIVYPYNGIPSEAFSYIDEFSMDNPPENVEDEDDDEDWIDPAGGMHYGYEDDPAHQYEALDDSKYYVKGIFEQEDDEVVTGDETELTFPDDFSTELETPKPVEVVDGEAVEKTNDEEMDLLFSDEETDVDSEIDSEVEDLDDVLEEPEDEFEEDDLEDAEIEGEPEDELGIEDIESPGEDIEVEEPGEDIEVEEPEFGKEDRLTGTEPELIRNNLFGGDEEPEEIEEPIGEEPPIMEDEEPEVLEPEETDVDVEVKVETDTEEAKMVRSQLINIQKSVEELLASIKPGQDMEPWVQAKLTLAQDYLQTVKNNLLDRDEEMNEAYEEVYDDIDTIDRSSITDYSAAYFNMDEFMPEDPESQKEYLAIIKDRNLNNEDKAENLANFIDDLADEDIMYAHFPEGGSTLEFAEYILMKK